MSLKVRAMGAVSVLFSLLFAGCGGNGGCGGSNNGGESLPWTVVDRETLNLPPGGVGLATVRVQNQNTTGGTYQLSIQPDGTQPTGWTVTGTDGFLDGPFGNTVDMEVTVRVAANAAPGQRFVNLKISDDDNSTEDFSLNITVNVGGAVGTAIREKTAFVPSLDEVFESGLEISNGEDFPIATLVEPRPLNFTGETDALVWFSPKAGGFVVDPGDVDTMRCVALPRTNSVTRTFRLENYFFNPWQNGREEKYATQFSVKPPNDVRYTINTLDWFMGVSMSDPDKTATYEVTFDPVPTGKAGLYSFSVSGLNTLQYTATVTPPNAPVNSKGDPVKVTITVNRIGAGVGETVDEFSVLATHDAHTDVSDRLRLPIRTYAGR